MEKNIISDVTTEITKKINNTNAKLDFVQIHMTFCPNYPKDRTLNDVDNAISNICRYSKRTLYYAQNFNNNLNLICNDLSNRVTKQDTTISTNIKDDIFFDFDAFIFSFKSITEETIGIKSKGLDNCSKKEFKKISKFYLEDFIKPYLIPVRNEVVHLNNYGTSFGSIACINQDNRLSIKCNYKLNDKKIDLIELFIFFFNNILKIIDSLLGVYIHYNFTRWGIPTKDIFYNSNGCMVNHKSFNIPGYDGINKAKKSK